MDDGELGRRIATLLRTQGPGYEATGVRRVMWIDTEFRWVGEEPTLDTVTSITVEIIVQPIGGEPREAEFYVKDNRAALGPVDDHRTAGGADKAGGTVPDDGGSTDGAVHDD